MSRLMARWYDRATEGMERAGLRSWRQALLADLEGTVVELGAGTGSNLAHYPPGVTRLVLTEPDPHMRRRLEARVATDAPTDLRARIEVVPAPAEAIPLPDDAADAVVATLVLCSVDDPDRALSEVRRVLRPGGGFVHLEHVAAVEDPKRLAWQRRIEPVWRRLADDCHLTRATDQAIVAAGLRVVVQRREDLPVPAPWVNRMVRGVAVEPGPEGDPG